MKKNIVAGILAIVFITGAAYAAPASALTVDELQTQIKELLAKIADLRLQLNTAVKVEAPPIDQTVMSTPNKHRICSILKRDLSQGTQGDDARGLQEFLSAEGYLSANATGYFGPMTAQAVAKWQSSEGVTAVGNFGPMSRERLKIWCGGGGSVGNRNFSASPLRGSAPLTVTFYTYFSRNESYHRYTIDHGDGSSQNISVCGPSIDLCGGGGQNTHTYNSNGSYTATFNEITDPCAGNPLCLAPVSTQVIGKVQIQVGAVACTKEYKPVCGSKPIVCITTPCNPIQQTYGNRCEMNAD